MSAATKDLPDPLDPMPTMSVSNPDDLLAQMADEAIDRLMADADMGAMPSGPPVPMDEVAPGEPDAATLIAEAASKPHATAPTSEEPAATQPEPVPAAGSASTAVTEAELAGPAVATPTAETPVGPATVPPAPAADAVVPPRAVPERQALLGDAPRLEKPSVLLWPLRVLNAPFAWLSDDARRLIGLLAIVSLVPTAVAVGYLYWLRHHH